MSVAATVPARLGGLDRIARQSIEGWAFDPQTPGERLRVVVLLDGDVCGFATADQFRDELLENGIGDGAHGFRCDLPPAKLHAARLVTIIAECGGTFALIHEYAAPVPPVALAAVRDRVAIHFDISDLLEFLANHREVSGIQRVQCGYLSNALEMADGDFDIRVCAQLAGLCRYVEIAPDRAGEMLVAIDAKRHLSAADWRDFIEAERLGTGRAPAFQPGDIILTMGAPWVYDDYYRAIEAAKAKHGVRYFQIFHDLIPTLMPEAVSIGLIGGFTRSIAGMLVCADHVLANSRYSEGDLRSACARLGAACPPTSVIPLGGTIDYRQQARQPEPSAPPMGPSPRELYGDFILCVGTIEPRKNHVYLYNVWKRMLQELGPGIPRLVCVGRLGWHVEDLQRYLKVSANLDGYFVHLADVSDTDLKRFYRDCLFTVFPSLYEGWGLPVAESLLYGKLCVSSNATSMPEVGGEWVAYIDPRNANDGFDVIAGLIRNPSRIAAWERRLREGYEPLTWAAATIGLLEAVSAAHEALPEDDEPAGPDLRGLPSRRIEIGKTCEFSAAIPNTGPLGALAAELRIRLTGALLDGQDWHPMEEWGVWACGAAARLRFVLPDDAPRDLVCYLGVRLPADFGSQPCQLSVNRTHQARLLLQSGPDQEIRIDLAAKGPHARGRAREVSIELELETLMQPAADAVDQRLLGIGVRALCVCAADNLAERLAYFERAIKSVEAARSTPQAIR